MASSISNKFTLQFWCKGWHKHEHNSVYTCYISTLRKVTYTSSVISRIKLQDYGMSHISKMADISAQWMKATLVCTLMSHPPYTVYAYAYAYAYAYPYISKTSFPAWVLLVRTLDYKKNVGLIFLGGWGDCHYWMLLQLNEWNMLHINIPSGKSRKHIQKEKKFHRLQTVHLFSLKPGTCVKQHSL